MTKDITKIAYPLDTNMKGLDRMWLYLTKLSEFLPSISPDKRYIRKDDPLYSYDNLSTALSISPSTVKTHLQKLRKLTFEGRPLLSEADGFIFLDNKATKHFVLYTPSDKLHQFLLYGIGPLGIEVYMYLLSKYKELGSGVTFSANEINREVWGNNSKTNSARRAHINELLITYQKRDLLILGDPVFKNGSKYLPIISMKEIPNDEKLKF